MSNKSDSESGMLQGSIRNTTNFEDDNSEVFRQDTEHVVHLIFAFIVFIQPIHEQPWTR